ncbi:hypothetical protein CHS0354_001633 [Potamilus streckersoni]|uniref:Uncharacterized protein n=1 Tax=Potamilus streckersoni TaxID=2493646 RepID=A0AAE0SQW6_9BIVA|nr:hypothetical protein CHS0354_001633 [Potamilus streckersoni]
MSHLTELQREANTACHLWRQIRLLYRCSFVLIVSATKEGQASPHEGYEAFYPNDTWNIKQRSLIWKVPVAVTRSSIGCECHFD